MWPANSADWTPQYSPGIHDSFAKYVPVRSLATLEIRPASGSDTPKRVY